MDKEKESFIGKKVLVDYLYQTLRHEATVIAETKSAFLVERTYLLGNQRKWVDREDCELITYEV